MTPRIIRGADLKFARPAGWDESEHGHCGDLHARVTGNLIETAWQPSADELVLLNQGGVVILGIVGSQPPVSLQVEPATAAVPRSRFGAEPTARHLVNSSDRQRIDDQREREFIPTMADETSRTFHAGPEPVEPREDVAKLGDN